MPYGHAQILEAELTFVDLFYNIHYFAVNLLFTVSPNLTFQQFPVSPNMAFQQSETVACPQRHLGENGSLNM